MRRGLREVLERLWADEEDIRKQYAQAAMPEFQIRRAERVDTAAQPANLPGKYRPEQGDWYQQQNSIQQVLVPFAGQADCKRAEPADGPAVIRQPPGAAVPVVLS